MEDLDSKNICLNDSFRSDNKFCCTCSYYSDCIGITDESDDYVF